MWGQRYSTTAEIETLVSARQEERGHLEYKAHLPGTSDRDKVEFLADVSSFANTSGGVILFGVDEERDQNGNGTGIPSRAQGIANFNVDVEKLRLEGLLRDGIAPRIGGVEFTPVPGFPEGPVLAIQVPDSYHAPHMVTLGGRSRFYGRSDAGKYQLDVHQIRSAFTGSSTAADALRSFRLDRLARVKGGDTPVPLAFSSALVMHAVPLTKAYRALVQLRGAVPDCSATYALRRLESPSELRRVRDVES